VTARRINRYSTFNLVGFAAPLGFVRECAEPALQGLIRSKFVAAMHNKITVFMFIATL
jgi:hypothetical protein